MGGRAPVSREARPEALGNPAAEVEECIGRLAAEVRGEEPYAAVKTVHDALSEDLTDEERSVPGLGELFWDRERTLWWIGVVTGVHPSLVTYRLHEDDIPLMQRNYTGEATERIRARRDREPE
jgi:hypothetical protein